jgi:hypothetical protein
MEAMRAAATGPHQVMRALTAEEFASLEAARRGLDLLEDGNA